jgi:hypothetical protein
MEIKRLKKKKYAEEEDYSDISMKNSKKKLIDHENDKLLNNYEDISDYNSKKTGKKLAIQKESAYRLRLLRETLGLTLQKMANLCNLPLGKFTRLEGGGTAHGTPISKEDATRICFAVLHNFGIVIKPQWLLCLISEMPLSLLTPAESRQRIENYINNIIDNRMIQDPLSIFPETHLLSRIHGGNTTFTMISDNRINSKYKKGDYVGGLLIDKHKYHLINSYDCIISFTKEPDVRFIRTIYFPVNNQNDTLYNNEILLLLTETKEPVIVKKEEISNIWLIFYHRKNYEEFTSLLEKIYDK